MDLKRLERAATPIVGRSSLAAIGRSWSLRCDARQAEARFAALDDWLDRHDCFRLNEVLPAPIVKGPQPAYLEIPEPDAVPVLSTVCVQPLRLMASAARYVTREDFEAIPAERRPRAGDLLLTVDGGPSIGKPAVFDLEGDFGVDSHVAILRPAGISSEMLALLLASPLGQVQFRRAESGASGQTAVTEEDIRRFRFPRATADEQAGIVARCRAATARARALRREADALERASWDDLLTRVLGSDASEARDLT